MNQFRTKNHRALLAFTFLAPIAGVGVARFVLPLPGRRQAAASNSLGTKKPEEKKTFTSAPDRDQGALISCIDTVLQTAPSRSPLWSPALSRPPEMHQDPATDTHARGVEFHLSSVMSLGKDSMAMIDGRVRREGDTLEGGWRVESIDRASGTVHLKGADGASITIRLREEPK